MAGLVHDTRTRLEAAHSQLNNQSINHILLVGKSCFTLKDNQDDQM